MLFALLISAAQANMSAPPEPRKGNITGDSYLKNLKVLNENLLIDMGGVAKGLPIKVRANYTIRCSQTLRDIDLVFIANNLTESRYKVTIDDRFVNGYLTEFKTIPSSWLPPDSVISLNGAIPYQYSTKGLIAFKLDSLTAGEHTLTVDYDAETSTWFTNKDFTQTHTFVYILRPTEDWQSFENLNLTVFIPDEWEFASNLKLEGHEHSYTGHWENLPARYLSVTIRKPPGNIELKGDLFFWVSLIAFAILSLLWQYRVARWRVERLKNRVYQVLNTLVVAILADIYFFYIYFESRDLYSQWTEGQLNPIIRHGEGYIVLLFPVLGFFIWLFLFFADLLFVYLVRRRLRRL